MAECTAGWGIKGGSPESSTLARGDAVCREMDVWLVVDTLTLVTPKSTPTVGTYLSDARIYQRRVQ